MKQKIYKFILTSSLYKVNYSIGAFNIKDAIKRAKIKFAQNYHVFGDNVKVSLDPEDLVNHIDELIDIIYKG